MRTLTREECDYEGIMLQERNPRLHKGPMHYLRQRDRKLRHCRNRIRSKRIRICLFPRSFVQDPCRIYCKEETMSNLRKSVSIGQRLFQTFEDRKSSQRFDLIFPTYYNSNKARLLRQGVSILECKEKNRSVLPLEGDFKDATFAEALSQPGIVLANADVLMR